jgi:hypothetical protein
MPLQASVSELLSENSNHGCQDLSCHYRALAHLYACLAPLSSLVSAKSTALAA